MKTLLLKYILANVEDDLEGNHLVIANKFEILIYEIKTKHLVKTIKAHYPEILKIWGGNIIGIYEGRITNVIGEIPIIEALNNSTELYIHKLYWSKQTRTLTCLISNYENKRHYIYCFRTFRNIYFDENCVKKVMGKY